MNNVKQLDVKARGWVRLTSQDDWSRLDDIVFGFHDGIVKEVRWLHGWYVNEALQLVYGAAPEVWLLLQLQLRDAPTVELRFSGVRRWSLDANEELEASVSVSEGEVDFRLSASHNSRIIADVCQYRLSQVALLGLGPFNIPDCFNSTS